MKQPLSNTDEWFYCNPQCLIGAEKYAVSLGIQKTINRKKITNFIKRHLK